MPTSYTVAGYDDTRGVCTTSTHAQTRWIGCCCGIMFGVFCYFSPELPAKIIIVFLAADPKP